VATGGAVDNVAVERINGVHGLRLDSNFTGTGAIQKGNFNVRIAVTATGSSIESAVDPRFGRAACFIEVDTETGAWTAHDNTQNLNAVQGAGIQAAQNVANLGVQAVLTGNVGPKAYTTLQAAGIAVYLCQGGLVSEAIEALKAGKLAVADGANVSSHW
jgi:predicted Fe-Mo cluster-binding NifX family protein